MRNELCAQKRIETVQRNIAVNIDMNNVLTELEEFYRDHRETPTPAERKELGKRLIDIYAHFNATSWWWPEEMFAQGRLLRLMPEKREPEARRAIELYKANLIESTHAVDGLWREIVRVEYVPGNPQIETLIRDTRQRCEALQRARDERARNMMLAIFGG